MVFEKKYNNGLTLLYEELPLKSFSFCVLVKSGSKFETPSNYGVAHFLEHTLFNGTKNRTEFEIARALEENGISNNAATSRNYTYFYVSSIKQQFETAIEILSDMFFNSIFDKDKLELERKTIIEEYNGAIDPPNSKVGINLLKTMLSNSYFDSLVLGNKESINSLQVDDLKDFYNKHYTPDNTILSFSGGLPFEKVEKLIEKNFINNFNNLKCEKITPKDSFVNQKYIFESKDINQTLLNIGYMLPTNTLKEYREISLFNTIFSSGMNSRLFERLRNKLGLCYAINGSKMELKDYNAVFVISMKSNRENEFIALKEIDKEVNKIIKNGITKREFKKAKNIALKSIIFDDEVFLYRAIGNATQYCSRDRVISNEEEIDIINSITYEELNDFCKKLLDTKDKCLSIISKEESKKIKKYWFKTL